MKPIIVFLDIAIFIGLILAQCVLIVHLSAYYLAFKESFFNWNNS